METETDLLGSIFGHWEQNAAETERILGKDKAHFFIDAYNDALDIQFAISDEYPKPELTSLVYADFMGVCKEIHWLHVMFVAGNYPLLLARLRFIWELIFRALYADIYEQPGDRHQEASSSTVDDKHWWLEDQESKLNWRSVILPILNKLFTAKDSKEIEDCFKPTWDTLNCYVHPSAILRHELIEESSLIVRDAVDENFANKALHYATEVIELVWLTVLWRFPKAKDRLLADPNVLRNCSRVRSLLGAQPNTAQVS
jgi:hypothetical protein